MPGDGRTVAYGKSMRKFIPPELIEEIRYVCVCVCVCACVCVCVCVCAHVFHRYACFTRMLTWHALMTL